MSSESVARVIGCMVVSPKVKVIVFSCTLSFGSSAFAVSVSSFSQPSSIMAAAIAISNFFIVFVFDSLYLRGGEHTSLPFVLSSDIHVAVVGLLVVVVDALLHIALASVGEGFTSQRAHEVGLLI